jgi:hypothetical protein
MTYTPETLETAKVEAAKRLGIMQREIGQIDLTWNSKFFTWDAKVSTVLGIFTMTEIVTPKMNLNTCKKVYTIQEEFEQE